MSKAVVILSGGQDSVTCLHWALREFDEVVALSFDYGQRHRIELECAEALCRKLGIAWTLVPVSSLAVLSKNALTSKDVAVKADGGMNGLPSTFVPGRNVLFLTLAAAFAVPMGIHELVIGACETDFSGYPDCRDSFMASMETSLSEGMGVKIKIHRPLMFLSKAQIFGLADKLGALRSVVEDSHTCYEGDRTKKNPWGYGCGECPACELRKKGYETFKETAHHG